MLEYHLIAFKIYYKTMLIFLKIYTPISCGNVLFFSHQIAHLNHTANLYELYFVELKDYVTSFLKFIKIILKVYNKSLSAHRIEI